MKRKTMEDEYNEKMFEEMELLVKKENIIVDICEA